MSWLPECSYTNDYIQQYDTALQEICNQEQVQLVDIFSEWMKMDYKTLLIGGLHPNTEGHRVLFERMYKEVSAIIKMEI